MRTSKKKQYIKAKRAKTMDNRNPEIEALMKKHSLFDLEYYDTQSVLSLLKKYSETMDRELISILRYLSDRT